MNRTILQAERCCRRSMALALIVAAGIALAACAREPDGPSRADLETALKMDLGSVVDVGRIEIIASQDTGTEVSPAKRVRFKAQTSLKEPTYEVVRTLQSASGSTRVLEPAHKAGTKVELHGIADARKTGDRWVVNRIQIESENPTISSHFLAAYGANVVIAGSPEERALEARIAEEKREREEAERVRQAKVAAFGEQLAGTWSAREPAVRNGALWSSRDGDTLGMELVLGPPSGARGEGTGVIYDFRSPFRELVLPVSYVIDDGGEFATVSFMQGGRHPTLGFQVDTGSRWQISSSAESSGEFRHPARGNDWLVRLEKDGPMADQRKAAADRFKSLESRYTSASGEFRSLRLQSGQSGRFLVIGNARRTVYGGGPYSNLSIIDAAVVHQGLLEHGQAGIIEVTLRGTGQSFEFPSISRNGISSRRIVNAHGQYSMTLIEEGGD